MTYRADTALRVPVPLVRTVIRHAGRWALDPRQPWTTQRRRLELVNRGMPRPRGMRVTRVRVAGVPCTRVAAAGSDPTYVVVHLHGGGYCVGSARTHLGFAAHLSRAVGAPVVVPDYRLAPEHPFPAGLDDALAVWRAVTAGPRGVAPHRAALTGDSAGAGLALTATVRLRDSGEPLPCVLALVSPWLDLAADRKADPSLVARDPLLRPSWPAECALAYAAGHDLTDPDLSPVRHDLGGLPPLLVQAGADDVLVPDVAQLVERAHAAGVTVDDEVYPQLWHDFPLQAGLLAAADAAVARMGRFVRAAWSTRASQPSR